MNDLLEKTAYIYLHKNEKRLRLVMPGSAGWALGFLQDTLSTQHAIGYGGAEGNWMVTKTPQIFDKVLDALRGKYRTVVTVVEHSTRGVCTVKCQDAKGQHCECVCAGDGHGGQRPYKPVRSDLLVKDEVQVVTSVYETPKERYMLLNWNQVLATHGEPPEMTLEDVIDLRIALGEREFSEYYG